MKEWISYGIYTAILMVLLFLRFEFGRKEKERMQLLSDFLGYLDRFGDAFSAKENVEEAFAEAVGEAKEQWKDCEYRLRQILREEEQAKRNALLEEFLTGTSEKCIGEFALAAYLTEEWGDTREKDRSLLLKNLDAIRNEARENLLLLEEKKYRYALEIPFCLAPFFCLKPIEVWSRAMMEGLSDFYSGSYGFLAVLLIFLTVLCCFFTIFACRFFGEFSKNGRRREEKQSLFLLRIPFLRERYLERMYRDYGKTLKKEDRLEEAGFGRRLPYFEEWKILLCFGMGIGSLGFFTLLFPVSYPVLLLYTLLALLLGSILPEIYLTLLYAETKDRKKAERICLERTVILLKDHSQMRAELLLRYLKQFSSEYRKDLEKLEEAYGRKEEVLCFSEGRKKELDFLLRGLAAADRLPIAGAFADLPMKVDFEEKRRKAETEKEEREKAALARALTFIPLFVTVGLYLILPFTMEGLGQIAAYNATFAGFL